MVVHYFSSLRPSSLEFFASKVLDVFLLNAFLIIQNPNFHFYTSIVKN